MTAFQNRLDNAPFLVLDGGLATQLEAMGHDIGTELWSARLLLDAPEAIVEAHLAYLDAGAECLISASYQASRHGFARLGIEAGEADRLIAGSVELARVARDRHQARHPEASPALVAASVGPWGATQHDGSEYTGDYAIDATALERFHAQRLSVLDAAGADVLACETLPSRAEALLLARLLADCRTPAWLSFSCRNDHQLSDGSDLARLAAELNDTPNVVALGINCTAPEHLPGLIRTLSRHAPGLAIVVYPNSGEVYDAPTNRWSGSGGEWDCAAEARAWHQAGARIIGGCCRTGPEAIRRMRSALDTPDSTEMNE